MARGSAAAQLAEYRRKRDFSRTAEPQGDAESSPEEGRLRFVVQKHAASHLHFDLRLELDGVMKSWAVPKGPSSDPGVKRLAMQVEDHPISYNEFEGTIPKGEYGGGTVMLWDVGTYSVEAADGEHESAMRERYRKGDVKVTFHGQRMKGSYALVRMKPRDGDTKPSWLMIKHRDEHAGRGDIATEFTTSVVTGRAMDEIASDAGSDVWHSNREPSKKRSAPPGAETAGSRAVKTGSSRPDRGRPVTPPLQPMLASTGSSVPEGDWTFEPKYDGIRVLAYCTKDEVLLITRNNLDKSRQFPEITEALRKVASSARRSLVLDGEIVALDGDEPGRFQGLQGRMHVTSDIAIAQHRKSSPAAIFIFDILMDGDDPLVHEPWEERRKRLEKRLAKRVSPVVRLVESQRGDGEKLLAQARKKGWEGIIAKRTDARYEPGTRSRSWLKLKTDRQQEFVVGGWTEPRNSRQHLGAILLGYYNDDDELVYAGHTGGGFSQQSLAEMYRLLKPLERSNSPFTTTPKTNETPHWAKPEVVVEVRFNEWTADGKLRQPIFLGVRTDKPATEVRREPDSLQSGARGTVRRKPATAKKAAARKSEAEAPAKRKSAAVASAKRKSAADASTHKAAAKNSARKSAAKSPSRNTAGRSPNRKLVGKERESAGAISALVKTPEAKRVLAQLDELCDTERRGTLQFPGDRKLSVTNLDKIFFPAERYTKGDLLRYYTIVAGLILPAVNDRPLVLRRFPNGIEGPAFYQQKAQAETPEAVRVETVVNDAGEKQERMIGGDLLTLLYTIQLGAISVDPWHSRVPELDFADYAVVDLDPGPRAKFARVVDVALWVKEVLDELGLHAAIKTSGATGLHVYIPLPPRTPNDAATLVSQMIATRVAEEHPKEATIVRWVKQRGASTVYVDYLQNIKGKTLAGVYCVRAKDGATVSTPLSWEELDSSLDPRDFTIASAPDRFAAVGDLWNPAMKKRNTLAKLLGR
ncbi:MAG TPA: non-homologous end-joining DNA ligase [Gemmatimonadaceae bacterium]|nr:non-homologous end-joining DNA ligase [Gemmatimonadaceae bacterium]